MVWTKEDTTIRAHSADTTGLTRRDNNVVKVKLTKDEALALIQEISAAFATEGVPSMALFDGIVLVIENPNEFYPKEVE